MSSDPTLPQSVNLSPEDWGKLIYNSYLVWLKEQDLEADDWEALSDLDRKMYTEFMFTLCRMSQKAVLSHFMGVAQVLMQQSHNVKGLQNRKERQAGVKGMMVGLQTFNGMVTLDEIEQEMEREEQVAAATSAGNEGPTYAD